MKKLFVVLVSALTIAACGNGNSNHENHQDSTATSAAEKLEFYGEKITEDSAIALAQLQQTMGEQKEMNVKLTASVEEVCQKKGCWMNLTDDAGNKIRVTFKDYGFFMPKDCAGRTAIVNGVAKIEETSVADLQEYARDAGKTKDEVAAITEPKKELVFEASGVILK